MLVCVYTCPNSTLLDISCRGSIMIHVVKVFLKAIPLTSTSEYTLKSLNYQSPLILTEIFQHNLINISYLTACYLYQVMMTLHFLNDVANDTESTQKSKITSNC